MENQTNPIMMTETRSTERTATFLGVTARILTLLAALLAIASLADLRKSHAVQTAKSNQFSYFG